jgi:uncharacterized membrane protein
MNSTKHKLFHWGAIASLALLIIWNVAWEMWLSPLKPGGSWLVLKAVPLLFPLLGVIKRDIYTLQWTSMMILIYFIEGVVRAYGDKVTPWLGWGEVAIVVVYFMCAILYVQPYKKAARQAARELLEKVNTSKTK